MGVLSSATRGVRHIGWWVERATRRWNDPMRAPPAGGACGSEPPGTTTTRFADTVTTKADDGDVPHGSERSPLLAGLSGKDAVKTQIVRSAWRRTSLLQGPPKNPVSERSKLRFRLRNTALVLLYFGIVLAIYVPLEGQWVGTKTTPVLDALYFAAVTVTTVGYGDLTPTPWQLKLFLGCFVWISFGLVVIVLGEAAGWVLSRQEAMVQSMAAARLSGTFNARAAFSGWRRQHRLQGMLAFLALVVSLSTGVAIFAAFETDGDLAEAFYAASLTATTVGYGDVVFKTVEGRALAVPWILISTMISTAAVGILAAYRAEEKQHALIERKVCSQFTVDDFARADYNHDGNLTEWEFVLYKLMEVEMVDPVFVSLLREQYHASGADSPEFHSPPPHSPLQPPPPPIDLTDPHAQADQ
mmetsp:Transcript_21179/g.55174  ORF Transcript_21179/g.55174 Transcript_21179/m.55174 type:complete len:414 (+) Transcript_21179:52-1293(+)